MLQPAATPAQSVLALSVGAPVTAGENLDIPEGFAALLASGLTSSVTVDAAPAAMPAATLAEGAALIRQAGKESGNLTGNLSGKILPVVLPDGEALPIDAAAVEIKAAKPGEKPSDIAPLADLPLDVLAYDPAATTLAIALPTPLALTALPQVTVKSDEALARAPRNAPVTAVPQAILTQVAPTAQLVAETQRPQPAAVQPATVSAEPKAKLRADTALRPSTPTLAPTMTPITATAIAPTASAEPALAAVPTVAAPAATITASISAPAADPIATAPQADARVQLAAAQPVSNLAVPAEAIKAAMEVSITLPARETAQSAILTGAKTVTAEPTDIKIDAPSPAATVSSTAAAVAATSVPASPVQASPVRPARAAKAAAPAEKQPVAETAAAAVPATTPGSARTEPVQVTAPVQADNITAPARTSPAKTDRAPEAAVAEPARPIAAAELQPILALRDAQPVVSVNTAAPVIATNAAAQPASHDFAALVDRLVEARDAAMPLRAAIQHADFGQISLNFGADDKNLTVSLASADPDFAPAVQAAAAMQAGASTDNGPNGQRQDTRQDTSSQQQQSAGSASTNTNQAQSQAQSQGSPRGGERDRADNTRQANGRGDSEATQTSDDAGRKSGSGIYA